MNWLDFGYSSLWGAPLDKMIILVNIWRKRNIYWRNLNFVICPVAPFKLVLPGIKVLRPVFITNQHVFLPTHHPNSGTAFQFQNHIQVLFASESKQLVNLNQGTWEDNAPPNSNLHWHRACHTPSSCHHGRKVQEWVYYPGPGVYEGRDGCFSSSVPTLG